ncbi:hypothetical protein ACLMLE_07755 [Lysobacter capsici]
MRNAEQRSEIDRADALPDRSARARSRRRVLLHERPGFSRVPTSAIIAPGSIDIWTAPRQDARREG